MNFRQIFAAAALTLLTIGTSLAQTEISEVAPESEVLKIAALEALISAPPERALPLVSKVLSGNHSNEVKSRALFVLSQIELPEAQTQLLEIARSGDSELQAEAIRMVGIGGNKEALAGLAELHRSGDAKVRHAVLEAYLIAGDSNAVYEIAINTDDQESFAEAVEILGAMGARDELRKLRESTGFTSTLIEAYAVSGDFETLRELAMDGSDSGNQLRAIEALGIVGGPQVNATLVEIYNGAGSNEIKDAALHGFLISGYDEGVLELYRNSDDAMEKRRLLQTLTMMGSDKVMVVIDEALGDGQ